MQSNVLGNGAGVVTSDQERVVATRTQAQVMAHDTDASSNKD